LTDPTMIVMMSRAAGIITEIGGVTSHPAIVSREFGIPCVVAARNARSVLEDGALVELNGDTGAVFLVEGV
ncbi:MAG: PEP-utilizing enzyme, partial [Candidatus Micrarchaeota archaeon]